jgi:hypothetical protein
MEGEDRAGRQSARRDRSASCQETTAGNPVA